MVAVTMALLCLFMKLSHVIGIHPGKPTSIMDMNIAIFEFHAMGKPENTAFAVMSYSECTRLLCACLCSFHSCFECLNFVGLNVWHGWLWRLGRRRAIRAT